MSKERRIKMKVYRLTEEELLSKNHMPVLMILNAINEDRYLEVLESISKGTGFGEENGACTFPDDLDEFDKANGVELEGVEFGLAGNLRQAAIVKKLLSDYTNNFLESP